MAARVDVATVSTCLALVAVTIFLLLFRKESVLLFHSKREVVGNYDRIYERYFPKHYHASGLLILPYDRIVEPFEAWFAGDKSMSRIDYYYGKHNPT